MPKQKFSCPICGHVFETEEAARACEKLGWPTARYNLGFITKAYEVIGYSVRRHKTGKHYMAYQIKIYAWPRNGKITFWSENEIESRLK